MAKEEARSSWTGSVSFGMVQFPIRLFGATRSRTYRFNNVHAACGGRTNSPTVCRGCVDTVGATLTKRLQSLTSVHDIRRRLPGGSEAADVIGDAIDYIGVTDLLEIQKENIVKGVQLDKETFVQLTPEDMEGLPLTSTKTVEVVECVRPEDVPAVMQERIYYVGPDPRQKVSDKAFVLFREALEKTGLVAIGKLARSGKEALCAIRPMGRALSLQVLFWSDEIVSSEAVEIGVDDVDVSDEERDLAVQLIESLQADVPDLSVYEDTYRLAVQELVEAKAAGKKITPIAAPKEKAGADLMDALKASLEKAA